MFDILSASGKVEYLVPSHSRAQSVFEVYPRKIRELQIVFKYLFKRFIFEHNRLRQGNIRQHGRFLFSHCAADHKHDRTGVDKAAVFHFVVIENGITDFFAPTVDKEQCDDCPTQKWDKGQTRPQVKKQFVNLTVQAYKVERYRKIQIISDKFQDNRKNIKVEQPQYEPHFTVNTVITDKTEKGNNPIFHRDIGYQDNALKNPKWTAVFAVIIVFRF